MFLRLLLADDAVCSMYRRLFASFCALSHYCTVRELLPAPFPTWAGSLLLRRPGDPKFPQVHHIDISSADSDRHREVEDRTPNLTPSNSLDLQSSWITGPRHRLKPCFFADPDSAKPTLVDKSSTTSTSPSTVPATLHHSQQGTAEQSSKLRVRFAEHPAQ
ncbi:hypothetical protein TNIN_195031 [Trichonephila inaurata madagascariensis]|uniref:Uncharacterized protein n=1 Tax=Trichonephila inaurata madagascariensis TaxID=2747483 RepID=A0A8X7C745_9ARAC|nr:hypothetical protein TNIN_195031 [Trichonephila inaurata madagascariensis]